MDFSSLKNLIKDALRANNVYDYIISTLQDLEFAYKKEMNDINIICGYQVISDLRGISILSIQHYIEAKLSDVDIKFIIRQDKCMSSLYIVFYKDKSNTIEEV